MPNIITRKEAKEKGLYLYFTGKPCLRGHIAERDSGCCVVCKKDKAKERYIANRPLFLKRKKIYDKKNATARKIYRDNYYKKNKDRLLERGKEWRNRNPNKVKEYNSKEEAREKRKRVTLKWYYRNQKKEKARMLLWQKNNRGKCCASSSNRRARERLAVGKFTDKQIVELFKKQNHLCAICKREIVLLGKRENTAHRDHINPLSLNGTNWISNIQLLCPSCNTSKGTKTMEAFTKWKESKIKI